MLVDCDDPGTIHRLLTTLPSSEFQVRPVIPIEEAVRVEREAMKWRDGLKFE